MIELDTSQTVKPELASLDEPAEQQGKVFTFSPSQLSMFNKCGEQYRRRYIKKEIIPPAIAMVRGTAIHKGSEVNFKQKIESWKDLPKTEIVDASVQELNDRVHHEGLLLTEEEATIGKDKIINGAQQMVKTLSGLYADVVAPKYQPRAVEATAGIPIPNSNIKISGRLDTVTVDDDIVDLKSTTKRKQELEAHTSIQLTTYALTKHVIDKKPPRKIVMEVLIDKKVPEVQTIETVRDQDDYVATLNAMNEMARGITAQVFQPAFGTTGAWWCSKEFCGYWSTCPYVPKRLR